MGYSIYFGLRQSLTGPGTITFSDGTSTNWSFDETTKVITFSGGAPSYMTGVVKYINDTLTVDTTTWSNRSLFNITGFSERIFLNPTNSSQKVKILNATTLQYTNGTNVSNVEIYILSRATTGIIYKGEGDTASFPYTAITFALPSGTQEVTQLIFPNNEIWTTLNPASLSSIIGTSKTYYIPGQSRGIQFRSGTTSVTFVNVLGTPNVNYSALYNETTRKWTITLNQAFQSYGTVGYLDQSGFTMNETQFSEFADRFVEQIYPIDADLQNISRYSKSDRVDANDNIQSDLWIGFKDPMTNKVLNMNNDKLDVWDNGENNHQSFKIDRNGRMSNRMFGIIQPGDFNWGSRIFHSTSVPNAWNYTWRPGDAATYDWSTKQLKFNMSGSTSCVTRSGLNNGQVVTIERCDPTNSNQKWDVTQKVHKIYVNNDMSKSMHIDNGESGTDNKNVIAWDHIDNGNANFSFDPRMGQVKFRDSTTHCLYG
jgi:hypothetical protein